MEVGLGYTDMTSDEGQLYNVDEVLCVSRAIDIHVHKIFLMNLQFIKKNGICQNLQCHN